MKLNTKRTMLVGLAFLSICIFWQMYDSVMTLILTDTFHLNETIAGAVMAADNVLALFLLPLFGHISDKCTHPRGRRTPFIVVGTLIAAVALIALSFADNAQLKRLDKVSAIDDPAALTVIYNEQKDATLEEAAVNECNSGFYCFDARALFDALAQVSNNNAQGEFYLTDVLEICRNAGRPVLALATDDAAECLKYGHGIAVWLMSLLDREFRYPDFRPLTPPKARIAAQGAPVVFNPDQQAAIELSQGRHLVLAPPGCGKTAILTERIAVALKDGVNLSDMLCLTFTNRAARGMKERIDERFTDLSLIHI